MKKKLRDGTLICETDTQEHLLQLLYGHAAGRLLLKPLTAPLLSRLAGAFLSSRLSRFLIQPFIRRHHISMDQFESVPYCSYNEFFSRKIRPEARPVDLQPSHLISPCDSKLTVLPISPDLVFTLKHTAYTTESLIRDKELAAAYAGGYALIFRLTVDDYHRFCYAADGYKTRQTQIPGVLHTVNPIANDYFPIYKENAREYSVLHSGGFGDIVMVEVGALLVGTIVNHHPEGTAVGRGQEKGYFQFGGSTIVLLLQPGTVQIDDDILKNSCEQTETVVKMGEKIGVSLKNTN